MRVCVFGGGGFIGRQTVSELRRAGHEVTVREIGDKHDPLPMSESFDAVVNLAATIYDSANVDADEANDVDAADQAWKLAAWSNCRLFHASSIAAAAPHVSAYAHRKHVVERFLADADHTTIVRFQNVWGVHQRPPSLTGAVVRAAQTGEPLTVAGDGRQMRRWIHVSHVASRIRLWVERKSLTDDRRQVWGVQRMTVNEHIARVCDQFTLPLLDIEWDRDTDPGLIEPPEPGAGWVTV